MNYTKGPWTVRSNEKEFTIYKVNPRGRNKNIALTDQENAHLISAAPELYELAKIFKEILLQNPVWSLVNKDLVVMADHAINKAEGK